MNFCAIDRTRRLNRKNSLFDPRAYTQHGNDLGYPLRVLKETLASMGHSLDTVDMKPFGSFDGFIFLDIPKDEVCFERFVDSGKPLYLIIFECQALLPGDWDFQRHGHFEKVFTWNPDLAGDRYVRFYWPNNLSIPFEPRPFGARTRLLSIFTSRRWCTHPLELYSERLNAIEWFERNHPDQLDLFGPNWSPSLRKNMKEHFLNSVRRFAKKPTRPWRWSKYSTHKGYARSKLATLRDYRFSICYENARDIPGYITEKIFDCFLAGVVPIYLGWNDVDRYIPRECFIDKRHFAAYEDLYEYIASMSESEYEGFIEAMGSFLASPGGRLFDAGSFALTVSSAIEGTAMKTSRVD